MIGPAPVVIVGASTAGLTAAEALRADGYRGPIELVGAEDHLPYARPPLSKQVLAGAWSPERTALRAASELAALDIKVRLSCRATGLDPGARRVALKGRWRPYSELVIATGLAARGLPGGGDRVAVLRTLDDAVQLQQRLRTARSVVVVGAGVLGQEIASAAARLGRSVTLIGRSPELRLGTVGGLLSDRLTRLHLENGVELVLGRSVVAAAADEIALDDGTALHGDLVVAALGGAPNTDWLAGSGVEIEDGVRCDEVGCAAPGVHAIGDVARWYQPLTGRWHRTEHQTSAIEQALLVARRITQGPTPGAPRVPYFWSEIHRVRVQAYGWFGPSSPLAPVETDVGELLACYRGGEVTGVVGWGAGRAFRAARALVDQALTTPTDGAREP